MNFFIVLLLLLLVLSAVLGCSSKTTTTYPIAQPTCKDHCGNVSIPFPFGLTEDCYLNPDFFINCTNSTNGSPKPYLGSGNDAELESISIEGQLSVFQGIARKCHKGDEISANSWMNLSAFFVNQTANKFVAVGCNTIATITGVEAGLSYETGCIASCNCFKDVVNGSCSGIGCCQTTDIPILASNVNFTLKTITENRNTHGVVNCSYAFVVKKGEFNFSSEMLTEKWEIQKVPLVIDWMVSSMDKCSDSSSVCKGNTTCEEYSGPHGGGSHGGGSHGGGSHGGGYRCACKKGYQGNPYLLPGCLDIDECANGQNTCSKNAICLNTPGNYTCPCKKGFQEDGKGGCQLPVKDECKDNGKGCHSSNRVNLIALSAALGTIVLLVICFSVNLGYRQRKSVQMREKFFRDNGGMILQQRIAQGGASSGTTRIFTAEELKKATNNYDQTRIIGQGGFGIVYKGHLLDNRIVAVKKAKMMDPTQVEQFINEVIVLSQINHRNIVKLFGCCLETEIPLLVYEFISNGTLSEHLHNKGKASAISWSTRLKIATETAEVLSYLHSAASPPIIHRDVKSVNILLDDDYTARVSDFGASRLVPQDQTQLTTMVQGTFGYLDPEYLQTNHLTEKSDVYSFGVVLIELLTSRRALSFEGPEKERHLSQYFLSLLKENQLFEILDDNIVCERNTEELQEVALLAKRCLNVKGEDRPTMKEVAVELSGLRRAAKHPWTNNFETSIESEALLTEQPIPFEYDATFSIATTEYDSLKHHMELPEAAGR
ncbi:PREDICTED: wall-associated receptor kinase 2-like [Ipomoea nil]|uniref:wall-associated receptor kinase 2-like n=1 Tax=Ipomoea nil TaxID=35883 RepID=UPI00090189E0|nr:PREDICTED: wall-associated receptor kinase 2-like [Ipomoea nil]